MSPLGDLPYPGIEPGFLLSPALADGVFTTSTTWKARYHLYVASKDNTKESIYKAEIESQTQKANSIPGREDLLKKERATHFSLLA